MKDLLKTRAKGFTLIEVLLAVVLTSVLVLAVINVVNFVNLNNNRYKIENDIALMEDYVIETLINEIDQADFVTEKRLRQTEARDWLGLVLVKDLSTENKENYSRTSYFLDGTKLVRKNYKYMTYGDVGVNTLAKDVEVFTGDFDRSNNKLTINFRLKGGEDMTVVHYIRGVVEDED